MCKFCNDDKEQFVETVHDPSPNKLIIIVDCGIVTEVEGGPDSMTVEVWDYDVVMDGDSINIDGRKFKREIHRI